MRNLITHVSLLDASAIRPIVWVAYQPARAVSVAVGGQVVPPTNKVPAVWRRWNVGSTLPNYTGLNPEDALSKPPMRSLRLIDGDRSGFLD
jgi:hypothetical protein